MASPFPGMDPYLEDRDLWQGFHNTFVTYVRDAIQPQLPDNYVATAEVRVYVERESEDRRDEERIPDVEIVRHTAPRSGTATLAAAEPPPNLRGHWISDPPVEHREAFVNIRFLDREELVTSIEVLSPSNKKRGKGHREYRRKQQEMLDASVNLVEVDLLRGGVHTVAVDEYLLNGLEPYTYLACIHRRSRPWGYQVFSWTLKQPLPVLPVPLAEEDADIELNLQRVFDQAYANGRFHRLLRYQRGPLPRFSPEDAIWADQLLREAGLRGEGG